MPAFFDGRMVWVMVVWVVDKDFQWVPKKVNEIFKNKIEREGDSERSPNAESQVACIFPWKNEQGKDGVVLIPRLGNCLKVNGNEVFGLKVLENKDEISSQFSTNGKRIWFYFSTESLPMKIYFESDHPTFCIRCKLKIGKGEEVVKCPQCDLIYHESNDKKCWSYDGKCAGCSRSTKMEYSWKPDPVPRVRKKRSLRGPLERGNFPK